MKIYICADFSQDGIETLKALGHTVKTGGWGFSEHQLTEDELIEAVKDCDVLFLGYESVTKKFFEETKIKAIFSIRGGVGANVDLEAATAAGVPVFCTFGRESLPVSDFTIGVMLSLARKITQSNDELHRGVFTAPAGEFGSDRDVIWDIDAEGPWQSRKGIEMEGKTMGLIGFGTVGKEVAKRAQAFGIDVLVYDPYQSAEAVASLGCRKVELDELCRNSDIISLHAKMTKDNAGMLGAEQFDLMKDGVFLINTARAGLIDEQALRANLRKGKLGGLGLDVFHAEPVKRDDEYFNYPNVILTPHIAGAGRDVIYKQSSMLNNDFLYWLAGGKPRTCVNPETLK